MQVTGITIHHSACTSINGKGYDFMVTRAASIIPRSEPTEPERIHVCLEGNFSHPADSEEPAVKEQLFVTCKLLLRLVEMYSIPPENVHAHAPHCPGLHFPWDQLVISISDRYH